MAEELAMLGVWTAAFLVGLWILLRFLPFLIRFFRGEFRQARDKLTDSESMTIRVKKESKKEKDHV